MIIGIGSGGNPAPEVDLSTDIRDCGDIQCDIHDLPFRDDSVAGATVHHVIEHVEKPFAALHEVTRVIEPGGWIRVKVPLGVNGSNDHTHVDTEWTPTKLRTFAESKPWQPEMSLRVEHIDVSPWLFGPLSLLSPVFERLSNRYPEWCAYRAGGGEITAVYRVT